MRQSIDRWTIVGWGMLLMPLLTMWHEIAGHAASCAAQGGKVATIGAFYVECTGLRGIPSVIVASAGVIMNAMLAAVAYWLWRRARSDRARLALWLVWVSEAFVASGYFLFSGVTGVGDLGVGSDGGLGPLGLPQAARLAEIAIGGGGYFLLVKAGIRALTEMLGGGIGTQGARRNLAHVYYATAGASAVLVGLMNPLGIFITIMSAAASSFGGLAGFISIGFACPRVGSPKAFTVGRSWPVIAAGALSLAAFAVVLGPSVHF